MRQRELAERPGVDPRADEIAGSLRALADPVRLRLLGLLGHGDCPVGPLAAALGIGQSLTSFHLAALADAGLLTLERAGRFTYARLRVDAVAALFGQVFDLVSAPALDAILDAHEDELAGALAHELSGRFGRRLDAARVRRIVEEEIQRGRGHRFRSAGQLARQHATERLRACAQADGYEPKPVPEVLFVCVYNAGRSQMAAALAQQLGGDRLHAWSAGSQPAPAVHDQVATVMAEVGIDLTGQVPKPWTNELLRAADVVVTMGCGEDCPVFPGVRYVAWDIPDPAGQPIDRVRRIRDELTACVRELVADLTAEPASVRTGTAPAQPHP
jgi:protein-tyrosine-phosphatase/DNA-binding transcriptional ArsR family regulator